MLRYLVLIHHLQLQLFQQYFIFLFIYFNLDSVYFLYFNFIIIIIIKIYYHDFPIFFYPMMLHFIIFFYFETFIR